MEAFSKNYYAFFLSIHAPTRGATICKPLLTILIDFQSTLLQEERLCYSQQSWILVSFQSTLLQEERLHTSCNRIHTSFFQSTLLQEERQKTPLTDAFNEDFQSTLLQEERLSAFSSIKVMCWLSIHAPTRGATSISLPITSKFSLSIHAPTRGATGSWAIFHHIHLPFNPRSYKRSDVQNTSGQTIEVHFQSTLLQEERLVSLEFHCIN